MEIGLTRASVLLFQSTFFAPFYASKDAFILAIIKLAVSERMWHTQAVHARNGLDELHDVSLVWNVIGCVLNSEQHKSVLSDEKATQAQVPWLVAGNFHCIHICVTPDISIRMIVKSESVAMIEKMIWLQDRVMPVFNIYPKAGVWQLLTLGASLNSPREKPCEEKERDSKKQACFQAFPVMRS